MELLLAALVSLIAAGAGAYFGAYLREKAKNLATREDIDKLVRQTEEIKASISGNLWVEQNRWTFKRDLYTRLLENLGIVFDALNETSVDWGAEMEESEAAATESSRGAESWEGGSDLRGSARERVHQEAAELVARTVFPVSTVRRSKCGASGGYDILL